MKKIFLFLIPGFLLAAGGSGEYDIIERTLNFLLFAGILFYFLAQPIKNLYQGRIKEIAQNLSNAQEKLISSKEKKELAKQKVEDAKSNAKIILQTAKKEAEILCKKIEYDLEADIKALNKLYEDNLVIEERKMTRGVVSELLDKMFGDKTMDVDNDKFVNIILKKVA